MLRTPSPFKMTSLDGMWNEFFHRHPSPFQRSARSFSPAINVWESETAYFAESEIPGTELDDIEVEVHGDQLALRGERKPHEVAENERVHRRERGHGRFQRHLRFPLEIDATQVSASLKNGILTITLPKRPQDRPRKVTVQVVD